MSPPTTKVLCFGSINVDDVFVVPHIVLTGETISSTEYAVHPGGKGANQSVALAKAGVEVHHVGKIGKDGVWVSELMRSHGVKTDLLAVDEKKPTGRAIIQLSSTTNDNAIVLLPGTNHALTTQDAETAVSKFSQGDWAILQNEVNLEAANAVLQKAHEASLIVAVNPAPCPSDLVQKMDLGNVDLLFVNETEADSVASQLHGAEKEDTPASDDVEKAVRASTRLFRSLSGLKLVVVTLGGDGAVAFLRGEGDDAPEKIFAPALKGVKVVDTTGAGDTFVGFFVASMMKAMEEKGIRSADGLTDKNLIRRALAMATTAGGLACEKEGAMPSIPVWRDVEERWKASRGAAF